MTIALRRLSVLTCCLATGCVLHRLDRNAPGHVDLDAPPADPSRKEPHQPRDPGDQVLIASAGPIVSGGMTSGGGHGERGSYGLGVEARALYGQFDETALHGAASGPNRALGVGFGWIPLLERDQEARLYAELVGRRRGRAFFGSELALGWTWEATGGASGPHATASFGPLFLRGYHLSGKGTTIQAGIALEAQFALLWSR